MSEANGRESRSESSDTQFSFFSGRGRRVSPQKPKISLYVNVQAMNLRFAQWPVMCGHYEGDSIAGAEAQIDRYLAAGALSQRERMGAYAEEVGSQVIVLSQEHSDQETQSTSGALVLGLGEWSTVSTQAIISTVRDGVLQYLLSAPAFMVKHFQEEEGEVVREELALSSLLIGYNSTAHVTIEASVSAIIQGVCEANHLFRFNKTDTQPLRVITTLNFIELYLDAAISAAYAVKSLPQRLEKDLQRLDTVVVPAEELQFHEYSEVRQRLSERSVGSGYWPRLMVTDAEHDQALLSSPSETMDKNPLSVAQRLKYVYLSERARAEVTVQQRQPGLIEALVRDAIKHSVYDRDICRTLFQLMVPLAFKTAARRTDFLLLVLDAYTANLPWEMLQADEEPLALSMAMVRQLVSARYRRAVNSSLGRYACVIGNPSTEGFLQHFAMGAGATMEGAASGLPSLSGAVREAQAVTRILEDSGYLVHSLYPGDPEAEPVHKAREVFNILFKKPYRILMIAAHGESRITSESGYQKTGVILSDGVMLTAAEIGQMEVVPDLVFLNCCHLAEIHSSHVAGEFGLNRLAYSLASELIEMGVRCVVAAGWAVDDEAASTFAKTFFQQFVAQGQSFGKAIWSARKTTYAAYPNTNTWGAYQAYGDPSYALQLEDKQAANASNTYVWSPVAPQELEAWLQSLCATLEYEGCEVDEVFYQEQHQKINALLERVPQNWLELANIHALLVRFYRLLSPLGFAQARAACHTALNQQRHNSQIPIQVVESLCELEAEQAVFWAQQCQQWQEQINKEGIGAERSDYLKEQKAELSLKANELIEQALKRSQNLLQMSYWQNELPLDADQAHSHQYAALLAYVLKSNALLLLYLGKPWKEVVVPLKESYVIYQQAIRRSFALSDVRAAVQWLMLGGVLQIDNERCLPASRRIDTLLADASEVLLVKDKTWQQAELSVAQYLLEGRSGDAQATLQAVYQKAISVPGVTPRQRVLAKQYLTEWIALLSAHADVAEGRLCDRLNEKVVILKMLIQTF